MFRWLVLALAASLLAGCLGQEEPPASETPAASADAPAPALTLVPALVAEVPTWARGDAFLIQMTNDGASSDAALVVTAAEGDSYTIETTSETMAGYDAMFDVSYVGKIRASDLAGSQQGKPIRFFDFPLTNGKSWSTTWDHQEIALSSAQAASIATPLGAHPGFVITGMDAKGATYVTYDFVPALGWWSHIHFAAGYGFKVTGVRHDWTGQYATATSKVLLTLTNAAPVGSAPAGTFVVEEAQTHVMVDIVGKAGPYARGFALVAPDHTPYSTKSPNSEASPSPDVVDHTETLPPTPGQWEVFAPAVHDPAGWFHLTVRQLAVKLVDFK